MKNFEFRILDRNDWHRMNGTTAKGANGPRPHIVPLTQAASAFVSMDALGAMGSTGLCPGRALVDGEWITAYRFVKLSEETAAKMIPDLEEELARVRRA